MSIQEQKLKDIADAIRDKDGTTEPIPAQDFPERIRAIQSGGIELVSIEITQPPAKTAYKAGERFDPAGMVVVAAYSNGATLAATGYAVEPSGPIPDGLTQVTVRYTEGGVSAEAAQAITVEARLAGLMITADPAKTAYRYKEAFDPAGMVATAVYSDGQTRRVEDFTAAPEVFESLGDQEVAVRYTEDGITVEAAVAVTVGRAVIHALPTQKNPPTYTGDVLAPEWDGLDPERLTVGGDILATNAGNHEAAFTPTPFYEWEDGTQDARTVVWTIAKAAENVSVSPASAVLNAENPMVVLRVGLEGDGVITAESSDESVAVVDVSGGFPVVYAVANASGSATITVRVGEGTNHLAAEATMEVTASFALIYGVEWNDSTSSKLSRTDAAAMFTDPVPAVNNGTGSSPFDDIMPWAGIKRVTDSAAGELVEIPKFWYRLTQNDGALKVQISPDYVAGYSVSPAHMDRGDGTGERNVVYIGRYHCVSGYKSATAKRPLVSITRATARTNIHKLGATIWQCDFAMWFTIWLLYLVEFADWDSQACIGAGGGPGTSVGNMGYTDVMKYHTGTSLATRNTVGLGTQYRWIEGLWDNAYDWVDGCYWSTGGYKLNVILNPSSFSDSTGGNVVPSPDNVNHFGYPSEFSVTNTPGFPIFYPTNFDSSGTSSGFADYWSMGSSSSVCIITGGYYQATYRKASGLFTFWNRANTASDTISSRLMKLP